MYKGPYRIRVKIKFTLTIAFIIVRTRGRTYSKAFLFYLMFIRKSRSTIDF